MFKDLLFYIRLILVAFAIMVVFLAQNFYTKTHKHHNIIQNETMVTSYHQQLFNFIGSMQELRVLEFKFRNGEAKLEPAIKDKKSEITQSLQKINTLNYQLGSQFNANTEWKVIRNRIDILPPLSVETIPLHTFALQTDIINLVLKLAAKVGRSHHHTGIQDSEFNDRLSLNYETIPNLVELIKMGDVLVLEFYREQGNIETTKLAHIRSSVIDYKSKFDYTMNSILQGELKNSETYNELIKTAQVMDEFLYQSEMIVDGIQPTITKEEYFKLEENLTSFYNYLYNENASYIAQVLHSNSKDTINKILGAFIFTILSLACLILFYVLFHVHYRKSKKIECEKVEAESASQAKSDFLAKMSHELRTPLNSIMGMGQMLYQTPLNSQQDEMVSAIKQSSEMLLNIVNDILDLSKIEAGGVELEQIGFDLEYTIKSAIQSYQPLAKQKNLEFIVEFKANKSSYVIGDPTRFVRILNNLVGNALIIYRKRLC